MKINVFLIATISAFFLHVNVNAQATDAPGLPYHVPKIMEIIEDAVEQPTDTNEFVQMLFVHEEFPAVELGQPMSEQLKADVKDWVETHVPEMQEFQWQRKVNYDKFYLNQ